APTGLQPRRPAIGPRSERRLRPSLPGRRGRRRPLLAAARSRRDDRVLAGRDGLAPAAPLDSGISPATARLRARRSVARAEVARADSRRLLATHARVVAAAARAGCAQRAQPEVDSLGRRAAVARRRSRTVRDARGQERQPELDRKAAATPLANDDGGSLPLPAHRTTRGTIRVRADAVAEASRRRVR